MDNIYGNVDYDFKLETSSDVSQPKVKQIKPFASNGKLNILLSLLFFLILITSIALCTLVILYLQKVASFDTLREEYRNITAELTIKNHTATENLQICETLKEEHQQKSMRLLKLEENQQMCEQIKLKHERVLELLSKHEALCKNGWMSLGLNCYFFSDIKLNWANSRDDCIEKGGHLVIITSHAEQMFLASKNNGTMWIGLNDLESEGNWKWVNNQPLNETVVKYWFIRTNQMSEPDNWKKEDKDGENCASLGHNDGFKDKWFDDSCQNLKNFICEITYV